MKQIFMLAGVFCLLASHVTACPWAGGIYTGEVGDIDVKLAVNASCNKVTMTESEGFTKETTSMTATNKGWSAKFSGNTSFAFDKKGKRARAARGGLSRSIRLKRTN